jgi:hypothetical protein
LHCCRMGAVGSITQNEVTVMLAVSFRPSRSPAASAVCSSEYSQACVPGKFVLHAALAPGSPASGCS